MKRKPSVKTTQLPLERKYCCVSGVCVRLKPKEETVCVEGGGFMVGSCSECRWHGYLQNGDKSATVEL